MFRNGIIGNGHSQTSTFANVFRCKKWFKYPFMDFFWNTDTIVCDFDKHSCIILLNSGLNTYFTTNIVIKLFIYGVNSICHDIQKDLIKFSCMTFDLWHIAIDLINFNRVI
ncbi:hypothetical protein D3C81_1852680 [compost metagenome]